MIKKSPLNAFYFGVALLLMSSYTQSAPIETDPTTNETAYQAEETIKRYQPVVTIPELSSNSFGEQIDYSNMTVSFLQKDASTPLNSKLDFSVYREWIGVDKNKMSNYKMGFENWFIGIPRIDTSLLWRYSTNPDNLLSHGWNTNNECSSIGIDKGQYEVDDSWSGLNLKIPGQVNNRILLNPLSESRYITKGNWKLNCFRSTNGTEGFSAISPNGVTYYFDIKVLYQTGPYNAQWRTQPYQGSMYVSKIVDRFGNSIDYQYTNNNKNLLSMTSSDGHRYVFDYEGGNRISSIHEYYLSNGSYVYLDKTWKYNYKNDPVLFNTLNEVVDPNGGKWTFSGFGKLFFPEVDYPENTCSIKKEGAQPKTEYFTVTNPYGAVATFNFHDELTGMSNLPKLVNPVKTAQLRTIDQIPINFHPRCYFVKRLKEKRINTLNDIYTWKYTVDEGLGGYHAPNLSETGQYPLATNMLHLEIPGGLDRINYRRVVVENPDGSLNISYVNRDYLSKNYGLVVLSETHERGRKVSDTTISYNAYNSLIGSDFSNQTNTYLGYRINKIKVTSKHYSDGTDTYNIEYKGYDRFGYYHDQVKYSGDNKKYIKKDYSHNLEQWVLGNVTNKYVSADAISWKKAKRYEYYPSSSSSKYLVFKEYDFDKLVKTYSYHNDGNIYSIDYNESNRYEKFEDYYRGKARKITLPCSVNNLCDASNGSTANTIIAKVEVNADGTTKSITDFNGSKTSFSYNPIGWLTKIDYADSKWADKVISYATVTTANDGISGSGIAASSLRQSISQGNYEKRVYHDAMLRPVFTRERDIANGATTRYQAFEHDHENRQTLASFPSSNAASRLGVATEYDALGRIVTHTRTSDNSSSSRDYLAGNKVAVTDSEGNTTTTTYLAYGQPTYDNPLLIEAPDTDDISLDYNEFAQVTSIRQGNITEKRLYDNYQQLCKSVRPETGITAYGYNAQRQQIWRALGTNGSSTSCDAASVPASHKTLLGYDNLGQLRTENFPDTTPDRTYSYDANGNLRALTAGNISWSYLYNSQNAIDKETLSLDGKSFVLDWEYNNLGAVSSLKYPSGALVDFSPNALGQATKAGSYVTGVSYHPNGQVKQFTFGNGIVRNVEMDTSGRIDLLTDSKSGVIKNKLDPSYDGNDNLVRLIDWVDRNNDIDNLVYDSVDRLLSADGRWGTGRYTYDGMGNILSRTLNNVNIGYSYNNLNQLSKLSGAYAYGYQYDTRGNIIHNGRYPLSYNLGQQMVSGKGISYSYDGHNRRVRKTENGKNSYSVYSQGGQLLHRISENGVRTDSIYLGKTIVAEVDNTSASEVLTPLTVSITISDTMTGGDCPSKLYCLDVANVPAHKIMWSSSGATSCSGSIQKYLNGSNVGIISIGGTSGIQTHLKDGTVYNISITCTGASGSKTATATASGNGNDQYM